MRKQIASNVLIYGVLLAGAITFAATLTTLSVTEPVKFGCYCVLAVMAAMLKVTLPGIDGTMTVIHVVVLIGFAELSVPECLIAGVLAAAVQCLALVKKRPTALKVLFNLANVSTAIVLSGDLFFSEYMQRQRIGLLMRLVFSAIVYFLSNTITVAAIIALTEGRPFLRMWKQCYLWTFPFFLVGAALTWTFHRLAASFGWQVAMLLLPGIYIMYSAYSFYLRRLHAETTHAQDIAALHLRTIEALAMAIDAKDQTTHDHLQRVQVYATEIAKELRLSSLEMEALQAGAMLHDIGKLAVPEHIISKPGKLTPEEFEKMKIHPAVGADILERVQFPYPVAPIVRSHHEKWDGTGYPDGLRGEAIPVGARILAVVDCLDALASDRQYRKAVPLDQAMSMVMELSGKSFDPTIVSILQRRYKELEAMARNLPATAEGRLIENVVSRGEQPDAGFEERRLSGSATDKIGFLSSIAAARHEVQTLFELSGDLGHSHSLSNTLSVFAAKLKAMIPYDLLYICSIREDTLHPEYVVGTDQILFASLRIPVGQGLSGWVAENNSPVINGNPAVEPGYLDDPTVITVLKSALAIPLEEAGSAIGVLSLYCRADNAFSRDHLRILQALGPRLGAALSNGMRLSEAQDNAVTDYLTGLPNSRSLYLHLDAEIARCRDNAFLGVFMCDLDGFKRINDEHGHLEGNRVLRAVATALKGCCRNGDYLARMGGDEFVVLISSDTYEALEQHVHRLRSAVELTGTLLGFRSLSSSVGMAACLPSDVDVDADTLLATADRRMYANKRRTGGRRTDVLKTEATDGNLIPLADAAGPNRPDAAASGSDYTPNATATVSGEIALMSPCP